LSAAPLDPRVRRGLEAQVQALRERTGAGERRLGWKVALNDPRVQAALRITQPVIGYLASGTEVRASGTHSLAGATRPAVEPEIAVHVGAGGTVAGLGPALEVIDVDMPFDDLERVMSHNVFHRAVVLGPVSAGRTTLDGLSARFLRAGREEHAIDVPDAGMAPEDVMALVAGYLDGVGESLREGDVIIAGSLVTALPAAPGERFELQVDGLGSVALDLETA
jgi:2-oxopent-4-enoate/cis-2-oxohex-4-enoate hydratase